MTDEKLTEEHLAIFDNIAVASLPDLLSQHALFHQSQVFTIPQKGGQLEVDLLETTGTWYKGRYLTIKYITVHGSSKMDITFGTLGVIGSRYVSTLALPLGSVSAQFGVC